MFTHCVKTLTLGSAAISECQHKTRQFAFLDEEVDRRVKSSSIATVPGSRKLHHVRVLEPCVLATKQHVSVHFAEMGYLINVALLLTLANGRW